MYIKNVFNYSIAKYLVFAIEGLLFFIISKKLGPNDLGLYGFYFLLFGYLFFFNFGSIYALNKDFAINKLDKSQYILSVLMIVFFGYICLILFLYLFYILNYFNKYFFNDYMVQISIWWLLFNIQNLIINIYRSKSQINQVIKIELSFTIFKFSLIILSILYFTDTLNLTIIINSIIISLFINIILNFKILNFSTTLNFDLLKHVFSLGIGLLIYELLCILLISMDRLFVSIYYSVTEMGEYTFSYTLNNFIFLFMNSILFIILPKVLIISKNINDRYKRLFLTYTTTLSFVLFLLIFILSLAFNPIVFYFYPEYYNSSFIFKSLLVSNLLYFITFPVTSYYISKNMHYKLVKILILVLILMFSMNCCLVYFKLNFKWISFINIFSFLFYFILLIGSLEYKISTTINNYYKLFIDIFIFVISSLLYLLSFYNIYIFIIFIIVLITFRFKYYLQIFVNMKKLLKKVLNNE